MSQVRSGSEPTAASLVGSLSSFPLLDVLELLARTGRTGELQVVGQGLDRRIWVDHGDLVDTSGTGSPDTGLFETACIEDGWFYFTLADAMPDANGRAPIPSVLEALSSQVEEWHDLVTAFPFDAMVRMSTTTPADEVQIRADQWQLLSLVGAGREVSDVLATSSLHPLDTLRTLRELASGQLVWLEAPPDGAEVEEAAAPSSSTVAAPSSEGAGPSVHAQEGDLVEHEPGRLPDPDEAGGGGPSPGARWTPVPDITAQPDVATGATSAGATEAGSSPGTPPEGAMPPEGATPADDNDRPDAPDRLQGPVMPPPISGDPWSSSLASAATAEPDTGDGRG